MSHNDAAAKFAAKMRGGPSPAEPPARAPTTERPPMREEDPRARARQRADELRGHSGGSMAEGPDALYVDPTSIPDGWTYEWKMHTVYGAENPAYQIELQRRGWTPVPSARHPEMMPLGSSHQFILRDGLILMECPSEIVAERREEDLRRARQQVRYKEQQLAGAPDGTFTRDHDRVRPNIKKSYESIPIPEK